MKKILNIGLILIFFGCAKEEAVPVIVDFEFEIFNDDFSIPVQAVFFNRTKGGNDYEWTFEGGVPSRSVNRNPGVIQYNQKGVYKIELFSTNQDGESDTKVIEIQIDDPVVIDFDVINQVDNFSPATYQIVNNSMGSNSFSWTFEGGIPASSSQQNPGTVVFSEPGEHTIHLEVSNGRETYDLEKTVVVAPFLVPDFDFTVAFEDDDFQIPAKIQFQNNSISATSYEWNFEGATSVFSNEENPEIIFNQTGIKTIELIATNGKETKRISKQISFFTNTNLRELNDIRLGINTAHTGNAIGSFYSIVDRKVYKDEELTPEIEKRIDLVFFGLSSAFDNNRFASPDNLSATTFSSLTDAKKTIFINSQELCNCSASLTPAQFDVMANDTMLRSMVIQETPGGLQNFNDMVKPRVVLFQTQEGKKGAIKIKEFVDDGQNSYILVDIKVQKEVI